MEYLGVLAFIIMLCYMSYPDKVKKLERKVKKLEKERCRAVSYTHLDVYKRQWDHYAIPLPFSKISVAVHDYGEVNKKQIPDLPTRAEASECGILLKDA